MSRRRTRNLTEAEYALHASRVRAWRAKNHERSNEIARKSRQKWRAANPERARKIQAANRYRVRREILDLIGGCVCAGCGFRDWRALQLDHRQSDGRLEKRGKGGLRTTGVEIWKLRTWVKANLADARAKYQVLCANCNWIKRHEKDECRRVLH